MKQITNSEWIPDVAAMTCRNSTSKIVVGFEKNGKTLKGKIKDMPMELFEKWAALPHGENLVKDAVLEAEEIFSKAFFGKPDP